MGKASKQNIGVGAGASAAGKEIADMLWAALNASAKKKKSQGQSITPAGKSQGGGTTKLILPGVPASGSANHGSRAVDMILGTAPKSAGNTTAGQAGATSSKPASSTGSTAAGGAGSPSSATSQNKNAFTDFLLHPDKYNPSKNGDKASLSDADQLMSSEDQKKIIYYQNAYANATSDIDKQLYHNLANQIRKKYGYTSDSGQDWVMQGKSFTALHGEDQLPGSKTPLSDADQKLSTRDQLLMQTYQFQYDHATSDEERKYYHDAANALRAKYGYRSTDGSDSVSLLITRYDNPTVGQGSYLDNHAQTAPIMSTEDIVLPENMPKEMADQFIADVEAQNKEYKQVQQNVGLILGNESRLKNPEEAAIYVAYAAGLNDDTKGFLLRAYDAAEGEAKLKILNAILTSTGWTRQTEYLYDSLSDAEREQADHMRVAALSETGDYDEGKKLLDQYYAVIADQKEHGAKTNQTQDDRDAPAAGQATAAVQDSGAVVGTQGNRATSAGMGVASSSAQAIDQLRDMAARHKEGDKISVAFQQDGKTVVYDTTVNAYGNLGLVLMRNATSKETPALAGTLNAGAGEQTGILGSPGANLGANHGSTGSADNGLAALLTAKGSDGTVEAFPSPADSLRGTGLTAGNITGSNRASGDQSGGIQSADVLTSLQMALDVAGLVPGFGEVADGLNALISLARGDYVGAGLSAAAMIPFVGWGATAAKGVRYGLKATDALSTALKYGDEVVDVGKDIAKYADGAVDIGKDVAKYAGDAVDIGKDVTKYADEAVDAGKRVVDEGAEKNFDKANFAQKKYGSNFSARGQEKYSNIAGESIKSVQNLTNALNKGIIKPSDVPIDYIVRDGNILILNTRSSQALTNARIPRNQWNFVNRTGNDMFEDMLTGQLERNGLTSAGTPTVIMSGGSK